MGCSVCTRGAECERWPWSVAEGAGEPSVQWGGSISLVRGADKLEWIILFPSAAVCVALSFFPLAAVWHWLFGCCVTLA